jgi:hypothetical protein
MEGNLQCSWLKPLFLEVFQSMSSHVLLNGQSDQLTLNTSKVKSSNREFDLRLAVFQREFVSVIEDARVNACNGKRPQINA